MQKLSQHRGLGITRPVRLYDGRRPCLPWHVHDTLLNSDGVHHPHTRVPLTSGLCTALGTHINLAPQVHSDPPNTPVSRTQAHQQYNRWRGPQCATFFAHLDLLLVKYHRLGANGMFVRLLTVHCFARVALRCAPHNQSNPLGRRQHPPVVLSRGVHFTVHPGNHLFPPQPLGPAKCSLGMYHMCVFKALKGCSILYVCPQGP